MSKKAPLSFDYREDLTSLDYQKIIVEQNHAIISLLAMQQDNIIHGGLNRVIQDNYAKALKPFLIKLDSNLNLKKMEEHLSDEQKSILMNLRRRQADGEKIHGIAKGIGIGLEVFFEEDE